MLHGRLAIKLSQHSSPPCFFVATAMVIPTIVWVTIAPKPNIMIGIHANPRNSTPYKNLLFMVVSWLTDALILYYLFYNCQYNKKQDIPFLLFVDRLRLYIQPTQWLYHQNALRHHRPWLPVPSRPCVPPANIPSIVSLLPYRCL